MFDMKEFLRNAGAEASPSVLKGMDSVQKTAGGVYSPSGGDMHVESALTNMSLSIMQDREGFVARKAFRSVPVAKQNDIYWVYPQGSFNRNQLRRRAPGTRSVGMNYDVESASYRCDVYAGHVPVTDQDRDNADAPFNLDADAVDFLTLKSMLNEEVDWSTKFFGAAAATPGSVWDYVAEGALTETPDYDFTDPLKNKVAFWDEATPAGQRDPIAQVRLAKLTIQRNTGLRPNVLVLGRQVFDALLDSDEILGRLDAGQTPGGPAMVTRNAVAALFELDEILVMEAIENKAAYGLEDDMDFIGGNNALLLYRPTSSGLKTPAAGYTFLWSGFRGANAGGARIKSWYEIDTESDIIEIQSAFSHEKVAGQLGFFFSNIIQ